MGRASIDTEGRNLSREKDGPRPRVAAHAGTGYDVEMRYQIKFLLYAA